MEQTGELRKGYMHATEGIAWWTMIICTCGLMYPLYRHRLNTLHRRTRIYTA